MKFTKFSSFIFLSNFSRYIIEIFIPIILFKNNIEYKEILLFLFIRSLLSCILLYCVYYLIIKINIKFSLVLTLLFFILTYYFLYNYNFLFLSLFSALTNLLYFLIRNILIFHNKKTNKVVEFSGDIVILFNISSILGVFLGGYLLKIFSSNVVLIISSIIFLISICLAQNIPLLVKEKIPFKKIFSKSDSNLKKFYIFEQFKFVEVTLFPLYLFMNIDSSFTTIGYFNLIVGVASICCIKILSKDMDKKNKDYLFLISLLFSGILILKLEISNFITFLIIALLEGIVSKLYDTIALSKAYKLNNEISNILIFETYYNLGRLLIFGICLFILDFKLLIYFLIFGIFCSSFFAKNAKP